MYLYEYIKAGAVKSWCLVRRVLLVPSCRSEPGGSSLRSARCDALLRRAQDSCAYKPGDHPPLGNSAHLFSFLFFFSSPAMTHHERQTTTWVRRGDPLLGLPLT